MEPDVLSDLLRGVRLSGAIFFEVAVAAPWVAVAPPSRIVISRVLPGEGLLGELVRRAVQEATARSAGNRAVMAKLGERIFIEAIRRYADALPAGARGWLAAAREPKIGVALALLHAQPARRWTVADLARETGLSRTVLAERFASSLGMPPMSYLARWRMQRAVSALATATTPLVEVAAAVGYGSEAAFSRAFKRATGASPAQWRAGKRPAR